MTKALVVDCDGMLIPDRLRFSERLSQKLNIPLEKIVPFYIGPFKRCLVGKADLSLVIKPYLREWGWDNSVESFMQYWFDNEKAVDQELVHYLKEVRGNNNSVYLATNQEKYRLQYLADDLDLLRNFDHIFASCEMGVKKPELEFYQYIYKSLKYLDGINDPSEVMYWDDQLEKVNAANRFGFQSHQFINRNQFIQNTNMLIRIHS